MSAKSSHQLTQFVMVAGAELDESDAERRARRLQRLPVAAQLVERHANFPMAACDSEAVGAELDEPDAERLARRLQRLVVAAQLVGRHANLAMAACDGEPVVGSEHGGPDAECLVKLLHLVIWPSCVCAFASLHLPPARNCAMLFVSPCAPA